MKDSKILTNNFYLIKNDFKKLIDPIWEKYISFSNIEKRNDYLHNHYNCNDMNILKEFIKNKVDRNFLNLSNDKIKELFNLANNKIEYFDILNNSPNFVAGFFILPKDSIIPIHNHPNRFDIAKHIYGNVLIKNYNVIKNEQNEKGLIKIQENDDIYFQDSEISILTPFSSNIHEVRALENSIVFDIILPAYDEAKGEDNDYFQIIETYENKNKKEIYIKKI